MALQAPGHNAGARGCDLESALRSGDQGEKEGGAIGAVSRLAGGNGVPVLPAAVEEDPSCPLSALLRQNKAGTPSRLAAGVLLQCMHHSRHPVPDED